MCVALRHHVTSQGDTRSCPPICVWPPPRNSPASHYQQQEHAESWLNDRLGQYWPAYSDCTKLIVYNGRSSIVFIRGPEPTTPLVMNLMEDVLKCENGLQDEQVVQTYSDNIAHVQMHIRICTNSCTCKYWTWMHSATWAPPWTHEPSQSALRHGSFCVKNIHHILI